MAKNDKKVTISINRSIFTAIIIFLFIIIAFLIGSLQTSPQQFLSLFKKSPTVTPILPTNTKTIPTNSPIPTDIPIPTVTINLNPIIDCKIQQSCGGGTKKMTWDDCNNSICCQVGNNWVITKDKNTCTQMQNTGNTNTNIDSIILNDVIRHKECRSETCILVQGAGKDQCDVHSDCTIKRHSACDGATCKSVLGDGNSNCWSDADCVHFECKDMSCIKVPGKEDNKCTTSNDCSHTICQDFSCVRILGKGDDECLVPAQCTHYECQNMKCSAVSGKGSNSCASDYDCFHYDCQNHNCVRVTGKGTDSPGCYSDFSSC